jgi:hypothetical protein
MFRSKQQNAGASRSRHRSVSPGAVRITIPHTPQLSTRGRRRAVAVFSREEQDQKVMLGRLEGLRRGVSAAMGRRREALELERKLQILVSGMDFTC